MRRSKNNYFRQITHYRRPGFDCVVKRLRMALYKPDCDSNDCELPSGQATPSILARGVACEAARGVGY